MARRKAAAAGHVGWTKVPDVTRSYPEPNGGPLLVDPSCKLQAIHAIRDIYIGKDDPLTPLLLMTESGLGLNDR